MSIENFANISTTNEAQIRIITNHVRSISWRSARISLFDNKAWHRHKSSQRDPNQSHLWHLVAHAKAFQSQSYLSSSFHLLIWKQIISSSLIYFYSTFKFEFMSQHLLFANCVPLILKFFNLNIVSFIQSKNSHYQLDFPNCVIGLQPEIDAEELEMGDSAPFRWRNVFSCINLLRILNKLTKYKRSRVMVNVL